MAELGVDAPGRQHLIPLNYAVEKMTMAKFTAGSSGNPKGRPPQPRHDSASLRAKIASCLPEILDSVIQAALAGDTSAAKILLERCLPALRPITQPIAIPALVDAATLGDKADAVLKAVAAGELGADVGLIILNGLCRSKQLSHGDGQAEDRTFVITISDATRPPALESA